MVIVITKGPIRLEIITHKVGYRNESNNLKIRIRILLINNFFAEKGGCSNY